MIAQHWDEALGEKAEVEPLLDAAYTATALRHAALRHPLCDERWVENRRRLGQQDLRPLHKQQVDNKDDIGQRDGNLGDICCDVHLLAIPATSFDGSFNDRQVDGAVPWNSIDTPAKRTLKPKVEVLDLRSPWKEHENAVLRLAVRVQERDEVLRNEDVHLQLRLVDERLREAGWRCVRHTKQPADVLHEVVVHRVVRLRLLVRRNGQAVKVALPVVCVECRAHKNELEVRRLVLQAQLEQRRARGGAGLRDWQSPRSRCDAAAC